jgi:hypothetical protein
MILGARIANHTPGPENEGELLANWKLFGFQVPVSLGKSACRQEIER